MKKRHKRYNFWWHFDRAFGDNKHWFRQIFYVVMITTMAIIICYPLGCLFSMAGPTEKLSPLQWIIATIIKGKYIDPTSPFPFGFQVFLVFMGSFVFSGIALTYINNILTNRMKAYNDGTVRYRFSDHILLLGGSKVILPIIKEIYTNQDYCNKDIVVLANDDAMKIRRQIADTLTEKERKKLRITVLRGNIDEKDSLRSVHIGEASCIYIIGEAPTDTDHDSVCMACWNLTKQLCGNRKDVPCFLMFNKASSAYLFRRMTTEMNSGLDTTLINRLESVAQRVLVHNGNDGNPYPALDRNGIGMDSERTVHIVLYGMTEVAYAMATTAAHLCHFPNFVNNEDTGENLGRRTKITLIDPNIKEEMAYLTSNLHSLFSLSKVDYIDDKGRKEDLYQVAQNDEYGNFLDIEWEFVKGNIADEWIRSLLKEYYCQNESGKCYLSMVLCQLEADKNIAATLYLPNEFHRISYLDKDETIIDFESTVPIFVFQPESEEMLKTANAEIKMFKNVFSFGSIKETYDPSIRQRIKEGKRINYIYEQGENYLTMTPDQEELNQRWHALSYIKQMSNIYSSMHIGVKLRSIGEQAMTEEIVKTMAIVEHNRWNIEKLLMGYEALPKDVRNGRNDEKERHKLKSLRETAFKHYCIAPYTELLEDEKKHDIHIVKNLKDIII